jgi:hypothetical protein
MKFIVLFFVITLISAGVYQFVKTYRVRSKKDHGIDKKGIFFSSCVFVLLLSLLVFVIAQTDHAPDTQCTSIHKTTIKPPVNLKTASDFFESGNYEYDLGNCTNAIVDYTKAISLNKSFALAYNNRAYTYMRMQMYKNAL